MTKSGHRETRSQRGKRPRQSTEIGSTSRIDPPHEVRLLANEPAVAQPPLVVERPPDEPVGEQVRLQADQLAAHLRTRQKELDHREAEVNSRTARLESEERAARLWLEQREAELASQKAELAKRLAESLKSRQEAEKRLARLAAAEAAQQRRLQEASTSLPSSGKTPTETCKPPVETSNPSLFLGDETAAISERMVAEYRQAMADVEQKRQVVGRRADDVERSRAALKRLRAELGQIHRETLEIRLATEELWAQLSNAAPPDVLVKSLGRIRAKLADQYRQADAELAEERKELETIRQQLIDQYDKLVEQKRQFENWVADCQTECRDESKTLAGYATA